MMLIMHDSDAYGELSMGGKPMPPEAVARRCGTSLRAYLACLQELDTAGVPSRKADGTIYSRRMVRDEAIRRADAERKRKPPDGIQNDSGSIPETFRGDSKRPSASASPSASSKHENKASEIEIGGSGSEAKVTAWLRMHHIDGPLAAHVSGTPGMTAEQLDAARLKCVGRGMNPAALACHRVCKRLGRTIPKSTFRTIDVSVQKLLDVVNARRGGRPV